MGVSALSVASGEGGSQSSSPGAQHRSWDVQHIVVAANKKLEQTGEIDCQHGADARDGHELEELAGPPCSLQILATSKQDGIVDGKLHTQEAMGLYEHDVPVISACCPDLLHIQHCHGFCWLATVSCLDDALLEERGCDKCPEAEGRPKHGIEQDGRSELIPLDDALETDECGQRERDAAGTDETGTMARRGTRAASALEKAGSLAGSGP